MSNEDSALAVREETSLTSSMVRPGEIMRIINHVHEIIKDAMTEGIDNDYGIIPGTVKKTLLKPGAEKLIMAFGLIAVPRQPQIVDLPNGHREVTVETEIIHTKTGSVLTVGLGSCSTMEGKYRYRKADLVCPECGQAAIIKGKAEFGGGWICYGKKGGCSKKWPDGSNPFEGVSTDRVEHDNPADYYNTVLKMASKRSMIDGAIRATASSAMFTQDMDDAAEELEKKKAANGKAPIGEPKEKKAASKPEIKDPNAAASDPQIKAIHAMLKKAYGDLTDEDKHLAVAQIVEGFTTFTALTKAQASTVIEALNKEIEANAAA